MLCRAIFIHDVINVKFGNRCVIGHLMIRHQHFLISYFTMHCVLQVSRCGMIYMEPATMGWRPIVKSWLATMPSTLTDIHRSTINDMFERFVDPCIQIIRKGVIKVRLFMEYVWQWSIHWMWRNKVFRTRIVYFAKVPQNIVAVQGKETNLLWSSWKLQKSHESLNFQIRTRNSNEEEFSQISN